MTNNTTKNKLSIGNASIYYICMAAIVHEVILALSNFSATLSAEIPLLNIIYTAYSNTITADIITLIFRIFILIVIIKMSPEKGVKSKSKALIILKVASTLIISITSAILIFSQGGTKFNNVYGLYIWLNIERTLIHLLIIIQLVLLIILIRKAIGKMNTIFTLLLLALLTSTYSTQVFEIFGSSIPVDFFGVQYLIIGGLYITGFIMTMRMLRGEEENKAKEDVE